MFNRNDFDPCPLCDGKNAKVLFHVKKSSLDYVLLQCNACQLTRTFPPPSDDILLDQDIQDYYGKTASKFISVLQGLRNEFMRSRAKGFLSLIPESAHQPKILDVGCAEGRLLKAFCDLGCECWGIEHPKYPSHRFINPDQITYLQGELGSLNLPDESFDLIILWHVLEHMNDPRGTMKRLTEMLAPSGTMIVAVPNFQSIEAEIFKRFWFHVDIPWHKFHFSGRSMERLAQECRLRIMRVNTLCIEQGVYGLLQSALNAMGWPRNELYEALKGAYRMKRLPHLLLQLLIASVFFGPVTVAAMVEVFLGRGAVLKLFLRK